MIEWGITAGSHDASIAVIDGHYIRYASQAERYSGRKNDKELNNALIEAALQYGEPTLIHWYENSYKKRLRQWWAGQPSSPIHPSHTLQNFDAFKKITTPFKWMNGNHHKSHAAAGFYTSGFDEAAILVVDAIGEFVTTSIWKAHDQTMKLLYEERYPNSLGLWYSAMTQRIGLKPNEEEYILMGAASYGDPSVFYKDIKKTFFEPSDTYSLKENLHRGCLWWRADEEWDEQTKYDIAASTQLIYEEIFERLVYKTLRMTKMNNLVLMGGCALNCKANTISLKYFDNVWIMPNPGDSGSAIGAIVANRPRSLYWLGPYLGENIVGSYPIDKIIHHLQTRQIVGVANGRAEFGPRALGNRSLFADPRSKDIRDRVNEIKKRQAFRPFAPVILEQYANQYFDMPISQTPYMQFVVKCRYPEEYPGIVHVDGTSRVQTVSFDQHPELYKLLKKWFSLTGCPMLLNTSLNIRGEAMVNNRADARRFQETYHVPVV